MRARPPSRSPSARGGWGSQDHLQSGRVSKFQNGSPDLLLGKRKSEDPTANHQPGFPKTLPCNPVGTAFFNRLVGLPLGAEIKNNATLKCATEGRLRSRFNLRTLELSKSSPQPISTSPQVLEQQAWASVLLSALAGSVARALG